MRASRFCPLPRVALDNLLQMTMVTCPKLAMTLPKVNFAGRGL